MKSRIAALAFAALAVMGACSDDARGPGTDTKSTPLTEAAVATAAAASFKFEGAGQQRETAGDQALVQRVRGEFVKPDNVHLTRLALDATPQIEMWLADGFVWTSEPGGTKVQCGTAGTQGLSDPRVLLRAVAQATDVKSDAQGYAFLLPESAARSVFGVPDKETYTKVTGTATLAGRYISTVHVIATTAKHELRADLIYADVGKPVTVTPPTTSCDPKAQPSTTTSSSPSQPAS